MAGAARGVGPWRRGMRESWRDRVSVVLVEPAHPGNVAAVARVMAVNGLQDLRLVNPQCGDHLAEPWMAWGGEEILRRAAVYGTLAECLRDVSFAVGCTRRKRKRGWPLMAPWEAAQALAREAHTGRAALVFGPERAGLTRAQLELCHVRASIPQVRDHPSYNLSHAVAIFAYELAIMGTRQASPEPQAAPGEALQVLRERLEQVLGPRGPGGKRLARDLYRIWIRARPTQGELRLLHRCVMLMGAHTSQDHTCGQCAHGELTTPWLEGEGQ